MERLTEDFLGCNQIKGCDNFTCEEVCRRSLNCGDCPISEAFDKLAEYEDAEEDGLLIKLPFSVGDTVYCVDKLRKFVDECEVITIKCVSREKGYIGINVETMGSLWHCVRLELVGKEVFLTKAEAEQALEKMKGE